VYTKRESSRQVEGKKRKGCIVIYNILVWRGGKRGFKIKKNRQKRLKSEIKGGEQARFM